jgi:GYF domain 2
MPLQVACPGCNAKLRAPDAAAGKKTKCPKCQGVISIPVDAPQAPSIPSGVVKKAENWHLQTADGSQYGPVSRSELDLWFQEGRISADCQLLKAGADQWQWASDIYPSLEQTAPEASPGNPAEFDFLGPATAISNYQAPPFPTSAPSFGGAPAPSYGGGYGGGYGAGAYGASANPYSSPSAMSYGGQYGGQQRTGLHPLVIAASVVEFLLGGIYALGTLGFGLAMILFLAGGAAVGSNIPANDPDAERAKAALAAFSGMGALCMLPLVLLFLALSVLMIYTGMGLLKKRFWAKIVAMVTSILHLLPQLVSLFLAILNLDPCSSISSLVAIALQAVVLTAMLLPDCTSDFK